MTEPHQLTRTEARRLAVRAQWLTRERPVDVVDVVRRLSVVQLDPTSAIAPSADVVLWSRLGSTYRRADLLDAVDEQRLLQLEGMLRVPDDLALFTAEMAQWPRRAAIADEPGYELSDGEQSQVAWVEANDGCRRDLLHRLRADGPLPTSELPDSCEVPWRSSGWNNDKNVTMLLGLMVRRGEVAVAGGLGRHKLWDLASRVYPGDEPVPVGAARVQRAERRLAALGIARATGQLLPGEPNLVGGVGEAAVVEGVKGEWRVDQALLDEVRAGFVGRAALLSPFDRLLHDRLRMAEIFRFEYALEMYKPAAKRRWGYYALPVLHGDRLVGKVDAKAELKEGVLVVNAVHEDEPFTPETSRAVDAEIVDLARWLDLEVMRVG